MKEVITIEQEELLDKVCDHIDDMKKKGALVREIVHELKDTMRQKDLSCLSAPQIGYNARIFCVKFENNVIEAFIDPLITNVSGLNVTREKDASIPGKEFICVRNTEVDIIYTSPVNKPIQKHFIGGGAVLIQEMMNHLDGVLLPYIGFEIESDWDEATEEERQEVISAYLDDLCLSGEKIRTKLEEDEETKKVVDAANFLTSVRKGETKLGKDINYVVDENTRENSREK